MKFTLSEIFCEVVSAVGFLAAFYPILVFVDLTSIDETIAWAKTFDAADIISSLLGCYVLGVIINIIGLPSDRLMKKLKVTGQYPSETSCVNFYKNATSELFAYRTNAWNHYYCFRNLFVFTPFGAILWAFLVFGTYGIVPAVILTIILAALGWLLYAAVKEHADFYSSVTQAYD